MSKSLKNVVTPDEIIEQYGADTLRLYEMFMSPFDKEKLWNNEAISGCKRFLNRIYDLIQSEKLCDEETEAALKLGHRLLHGVKADIENMAFNTAIAKMMEFLNEFSSLDKYPRSVLKMVVFALYPFAPHFAEECHELLGGSGSITYKKFPEINPVYLVDESVTYVVQVNGKVRGRVDLEKDLDQLDLISLAKEHENVKKFIEGKKILKEIYVPKKLVNFVIQG